MSGRVALVTGGAKGLGAAMCRRLAQEGARVAVADIDIAGAAVCAQALASEGFSARAYALDVTSEHQWEAAADAVIADWGRLDIVVNNAGVAIVGSAEDCSLEQWRQTQEVNLNGVFLGTRIAIRKMREHGAGAIVNISSILGIVGQPDSAAYAASKGGVRSFTKAAALHCARMNYGIRVNSVHPGYVLTDMVQSAAAELPDPEETLAQIVQAHPLGRLGTPEDIANAVLFLASDEAAFITGAELVVDGGYTAQ